MSTAVCRSKMPWTVVSRAVWVASCTPHFLMEHSFRLFLLVNRLSFGRTVSALLLSGFLQLQQVGASLSLEGTIFSQELGAGGPPVGSTVWGAQAPGPRAGSTGPGHTVWRA